ncbi:adenosine receptor A2a-like [Saccoglossus kowalevskii]|uniref:D(2) dopamine receptor-like n=1 Tax=Saccoglossus kowalevskii TaxID=10224 RepID=A0ABM0GNR9_SACKO|nr:PREDICTED: D(2) dopamine receptor-like [Saccoglossus kowalevskii]
MNAMETSYSWNHAIHNGSRQMVDELTNTLDCYGLLFYIQFGVMVFLSIPVVFGNILVILAVYQNHNLRTIPNCFIVSLAIADTLVGVSGTPMKALLYGLGGVTEKWTCVVICIFAFNPIGASLIHLMAIGIDRYIAILHPLHYHQWITMSRVKVVIAILLTYCLVAFVPTLILNDSTHNNCYELIRPLMREPGMYVFVLGFAIPFITMVIMYLRIFSTARHHLRRIYPNLEETQQQHYMKRELKAAITPCLVLGVLFICWIPQFIDAAMNRYELCSAAERFIADVFILINSGANPLIYALLNKEFRQNFRKSIFKMKGKLCK